MALGRPILRPVMWLAAAGLVASAVVHALALLGVGLPLGGAIWLLHLGIFVVWLPVVLVVRSLTRGAQQKDVWRLAMRGSPHWMRWVAFGFFGYAVINFARFTTGPAGDGLAGAERQAEALRGFSGHWMAFYAIAFVVAYAALHRQERRCIAGHHVGPTDQSCKQCGEPVYEP